MKKLFFIALIAAIPFNISIKTAAAQIDYQTASETDSPTWIIAPSIGLFSPMQGVGINGKGEMDVPSGKSNNVGWYEYGVVPGREGTAVLDAHVFAAFKNLNKIKPGEFIYVFMRSGKILSFKVTSYNLYSINALAPATLFEPTLSKKMNLITCAGKLLGATYSHRLIVSAELV